MKKIILLLSSAFLISMNISAQEGTPSLKIFSNFNYDISTEEGEQAFKEFELKRAYLGYSYNIDEKFSTKITFDVGSNSSGSAYTAFLKIASLKWSASENLNLNFGMVGAKNFKFMEKAWGRRYIAKSAQDKYKWANSADLGLTADYKISDNISLDAQVLNGEGYKKTQASNGLFRGGLGITYKIGNISLRANQDISPRSSYDDSSASQTITTAAIAYSTDNMTIGAEQNIMQNAGNLLDSEQQLMSVYGAYKIAENYKLFARYDDASETTQAGSYTVYGIERKMTKGVTIALNMQTWTDAAEDSEAENTLFLNLEYKF
ncbi:MAG: hypothetical protein CMD16_01975 [Flavobacteriales bacterium]|nr:hypothetical protein [Flavobacteriales bacterium]